ncbi:MAG: hypothetical protein JJT89_16740 [Nitriliruptoraceae bacterium]|nr:hypothetical protein [Nitriliruptoraceae bacterium]
MSEGLDLDRLRRILEDVEAESSAVSLPVARDRAVGIARLLVDHVARIEASAAAAPSPAGPAVERSPGSVPARTNTPAATTGPPVRLREVR